MGFIYLTTGDGMTAGEIQCEYPEIEQEWRKLRLQAQITQAVKEAELRERERCASIARTTTVLDADGKTETVTYAGHVIAERIEGKRR